MTSEGTQVRLKDRSSKQLKRRNCRLWLLEEFRAVKRLTVSDLGIRTVNTGQC